MFLLGRRSPRSHDSRDALNEWRWKSAAAESEKWHSPNADGSPNPLVFGKPPDPADPGPKNPRKVWGCPKPVQSGYFSLTDVTKTDNGEGARPPKGPVPGD